MELPDLRIREDLKRIEQRIREIEERIERQRAVIAQAREIETVDSEEPLNAAIEKIAKQPPKDDKPSEDK